jgi:hypothetical protein
VEQIFYGLKPPEARAIFDRAVFPRVSKKRGDSISGFKHFQNICEYSNVLKMLENTN